MKALALATAVAFAGIPAVAGIVAPPVAEPVVIAPAPEPVQTGSSFAFIVPLVAIALIAIALAAED